MSDARVLAELMGWKSDEPHNSDWTAPDGSRANDVPDYDTDLNAMREVWKFLKVRGLFDRFWKTYWGMSVKPFHVENLGACFYHMNNDLPGQVKAAIKVLKEAQG